MFDFKPHMVKDLERYLDLYYHKIIHIDLKDESFEVVLMHDGEPRPTTNNAEEWMRNFVEKYVHPQDREKFIENTKKERFIEALEGESINFTFLRRAGDDYESARFIFIPDDNSPTTGYIFVKDASL